MCLKSVFFCYKVRKGQSSLFFTMTINTSGCTFEAGEPFKEFCLVGMG